MVRREADHARPLVVLERLGAVLCARVVMHRAFALDVLACVHCGGRLRLIATLHDPAVIR
jgi:hypothetical protein